MVTHLVENLDALLTHLRRARVRLGPQQKTSENGPYAWAYAPEGNRFEKWEPKVKDRPRPRRRSG